MHAHAHAHTAQTVEFKVDPFLSLVAIGYNEGSYLQRIAHNVAFGAQHTFNVNIHIAQREVLCH
jgi:hypothetical protein